jgi:hypothetical protein
MKPMHNPSPKKSGSTHLYKESFQASVQIIDIYIWPRWKMTLIIDINGPAGKGCFEKTVRS